MTKLCACGCGKPAPIAKRTDRRRGWVKGQPVRFCDNHHSLRHGAARVGRQTPEHRAYVAAKSRCTNSNCKGWPYYGGRGIKFLFTGFEQFLAEVGCRTSPLHTLDRKDNDSHYMPGNIRWATRSEQQRNKCHSVRIRLPSDLLEATGSWLAIAEGANEEEVSALKAGLEDWQAGRTRRIGEIRAELKKKHSGFM